MSEGREKPASTVLWRIEDIGPSPDYDIHLWKIYSPVFPLNNLGPNEWKLEFLPSSSIEFEIGLSPSRFVQSVSIRCEWSLLGDDGSPLLTRVKRYRTTSAHAVHFMFDSLETGDIVLDRNSLFLSNDTLTVRLRVWRTDRDCSQVAEHVSVVTRLLEKPPVRSFSWRVVNFSSLRPCQDVEATVHLTGHAFRLGFFLTGEPLDDADLNLSVGVENANLKSLKLKISFLGKDGRDVKSMALVHRFNSTDGKQVWTVPKLASRREILEAPSNWLNGDDLTFLCELECSLRSYTLSYIDRIYCGPGNFEGNCASPNSERKVKQCPRSVVSTITKGGVETVVLQTDGSSAEGTILGKDFLSFYEERILSDFELVSGGVSFPVHKTVLSARSPVLKARFCGDAESSSMDVPDLDADSLRLFLAFLYTGTGLGRLPWEKAGRIYGAADEFEVPSLKLECSRALGSSIEVSNVCDILELADRHGDQGLTSDVHDFIRDHFDEVVLSEGWGKFLRRSRPLAGRTMREIHKRRKARLPSA